MLSNKKVAVTRKRFEIILSNTIPLLTVYLTFEMCSSLKSFNKIIIITIKNGQIMLYSEDIINRKAVSAKRLQGKNLSAPDTANHSIAYIQDVF